MFNSYITLFVLSCKALAQAAPTSPSQPPVVLPAQLGPYPVSIYQHEVKTSRSDPLAPTPELRRLMVTIYRPFTDNFTCPLAHQSDVPYIPPIVATALFSALPLGSTALGASSSDASSILANVKLVNCSRPIPASSSSGPLLLFSPGYGGTQYGYASILATAASSGYTVVAIDPTYEAAAVVFPDGYIAYPSAATQEYDNSTSGVNFLQAVRIADAVSVLDAIEDGELPGLGGYTSSRNKSRPDYDSSSSPASPNPPLRALMYGHSFGGSTAVNVAFLDDRVVAAANIDGPHYQPVSNETIDKPVLMMQSSTMSPAAADWPTFYQSNLRGWKTWVRPNNTAHYSFTDLPLLADLLGLRGTVFPEQLLGTVDSQRLQEIVWRYTLQFFDYVLKDTASGLLKGPSGEFPDVEFVGHAEERVRS